MIELSEEETQQYDRQLRLWGAEAQGRLKTASIMMVGVNGLAAEVTKNLVLAGVMRLALCDYRKVNEFDLSENYLLDRSSLGNNKAKSVVSMTKSLNPRVDIQCFEILPIELTHESESQLSIKDYDIVICCESSFDTYKSESLWIDLNEQCKKFQKLFFAMDSFGWHGFTFIDLNNHHYIKDEKVNPKDGDKDGSSDIKVVEQDKEFCSFKDVINIDWSEKSQRNKLKRMPNIQFLLLVVQKFISEFGRYPTDADLKTLTDMWNHFADKHGLPKELVLSDQFKECYGRGQMPVNAVLGGLVTQEIIKAISKKNEPFGNFIIFNGLTCAGYSTFIKP